MVKRKHNETFESLFRRFKKGCEKENILNDIKKHEFYERPSIKRKRDKSKAKKAESKRQQNDRQTQF